MPDGDKVVVVVREWASMAEDDLIVAEQILALGATAPPHPVCFHAHQCIEKYLKGLLVAHGIVVPRTHDLERLLALLPNEIRPTLSDAEFFDLNLYASDARYPGSGDISLPEAVNAVNIARRVRDEVRSRLPSASLVSMRRNS